MATRRQPRLRPVERELARRLYVVYKDWPTADSDIRAWNAHAESVEEDLPFAQDYDRACYIQDVAFRYTRLKAVQRG